MIGSITPLVQEAIVTKRWLRAALAYVAGSLLASIAVGAALGALGSVAHLGDAWPRGIIVGAALVVAAMEFGIISRPWPPLKRQTEQWWRLALGEVRAAFWWGIDLGNGFTTAANYYSFWVFALAAALLADPLGGAVAYAGYGIGRSALVLSGPWLELRAKAGGFDLVPALMAVDTPWHRLHATVVLATASIVVSQL